MDDDGKSLFTFEEEMKPPSNLQTGSYFDSLNFDQTRYPLPTAFSFNERPMGNNYDSQTPSPPQPHQNRSFLELSRNGLQLVYVGAGQSDSEAAAIRSNLPIPPQVGLYFYEVTILDRGQEGFIAVGFCARSVNLARLTGNGEINKVFFL